MGTISLERVRELLGIEEIPGSVKELEILSVRMGELLELNGEDWIRENRRMLLEQWQCVVGLGTIR